MEDRRLLENGFGSLAQSLEQQSKNYESFERSNLFSEFTCHRFLLYERKRSLSQFST